MRVGGGGLATKAIAVKIPTAMQTMHDSSTTTAALHGEEGSGRSLINSLFGGTHVRVKKASHRRRRTTTDAMGDLLMLAIGGDAGRVAASGGRVNSNALLPMRRIVRARG